MKSKEYIEGERKILAIIAIIVICFIIALFCLLFNIIGQTPQYEEANIDLATYAK